MTYNRYVRMDNGDYARIPVEEPVVSRFSPAPTLADTPNKIPPPQKKKSTQPEPPPRPMEVRAVNGLLEHLHLSDIDSGDLLLLSVLFFLFKQNADEELLMALGLLLIL